MAFEDYKDLDGRPEKASKEEIEALRRKYGVDEEFASRRPAEKKDAKEQQKVKVSQIRKDVNWLSFIFSGNFYKNIDKCYILLYTV